MITLSKFVKPKRQLNLLIASVFMALQMPLFLFAPSVRADGDPTTTPTECRDTTANIVGSYGSSESSVTLNLTTGYSDANDTVPAGSTVTGVCIKTGSQTTFNDGSVDHSNMITSDGSYATRDHPSKDDITPCYSVTGIGTTSVTIDRLSADCQGISHIDVRYSAPVVQPSAPSAVAEILPCTPQSGLNDEVKVTVTNTDDDTDDEVVYTVGLTGQTPQTVTVADGNNGSVTFTGLAAGNYTATVSGDDGTGTANMEVTVNACPASEEPELGSITIIKDAQPDSTQKFKFTGSLGDPQDEGGPNFTLVDDGTNDITDRRTFTELEPGTYTVTEPNVKGWTLESITCTGGVDAKENNRNAVIKLKEGENVICTFVNVQDEEEQPPTPAPITVQVTTVPCVPGMNTTDMVKVTVTNTDDDSNAEVEYTVTFAGQAKTITLEDGDEGTLTFTGVAAGSYSASVMGDDDTSVTSSNVTVNACTTGGSGGVVLGDTTTKTTVTAPQVLAATTTAPNVLADTGKNATGSIFAALMIISMTLALAVPNLRSRYNQ